MGPLPEKSKQKKEKSFYRNRGVKYTMGEIKFRLGFSLRL